MPKRLPQAHSYLTRATATLRYWDSQQRQWIELDLDSVVWFTWLAQDRSFRYTYHPRGEQAINFTVRPEKRGQRTYWQGWKTIAGQTIKKYLGVSAKLTQAKLDTVATWFAQQVKTNRDQTMRLYAVVVDLIWLVERLIEGNGHPELAQQAQRELDRIRREIEP